MTGLIAILMSCLTGYLVLKCIMGRDCSFDLRDIFIIIGLGSGISAQIVFYSLLMMGRIDSVFIIVIHLLCLCVLFFILHRYASRNSPILSFSFQSISVVLGILSLAVLVSTTIALTRPWGDWDGWSYWNYQSNFLFRSGHHWYLVFENNIQAAHHPWMLPLLIIWGWGFYGSERSIVPMSIGIIFTVSTIGLLIGALKKHISFFWSAIGGIFLTSIPFYLYHGTSQYADIEAAYFILLSSVLALDLLKSPTVNIAALTGLCLGLTASVKDNSIVAALLLLFLIIVRLYKSGLQVYIKPLIWGFITVGISVILMESFVFYADNSSYGVFLPGLWNVHKWILIGRYLLRALMHFDWGGAWLLALVVLVAHRARWRKEGMGFLVQFIIFYIILYLFIFAVSSLRLEWLLNVSFDRMLYLLLPAVIFVMFYTVGQKD